MTLLQPHDSVGTPSGHAASAGHVASAPQSPRPGPDNEHLGVGSSHIPEIFSCLLNNVLIFHNYSTARILRRSSRRLRLSGLL